MMLEVLTCHVYFRFYCRKPEYQIFPDTMYVSRTTTPLTALLCCCDGQRSSLRPTSPVSFGSERTERTGPASRGRLLLACVMCHVLPSYGGTRGSFGAPGHPRTDHIRRPTTGPRPARDHSFLTYRKPGLL